MEACGADDRLIRPKKFSDGKYNFDCVPGQSVIPMLQPQKVITEPQPEEENFGGTLSDYMLDDLDHANYIINDYLGDSSEQHDDAYSLPDALENKNTANTYV